MVTSAPSLPQRTERSLAGASTPPSRRLLFFLADAGSGRCTSAAQLSDLGASRCARRARTRRRAGRGGSHSTRVSHAVRVLVAGAVGHSLADQSLEAHAAIAGLVAAALRQGHHGRQREAPAGPLSTGHTAFGRLAACRTGSVAQNLHDFSSRAAWVSRRAREAVSRAWVHLRTTDRGPAPPGSASDRPPPQGRSA